MADAGPADAALVADPTSEEAMLLDHLRRFERARTGTLAILFNLSKLREHNRQPHFLRIAARAFDSLISQYEATLYVLFNSDMALVCRDVRMGAIDPVIAKLRGLFSNDPLTVGDAEDPTMVFASWYDFSDINDYTRVVAYAKRMVLMAAQRRRQGELETVRPEAMRGATLGPANLTAIAGRLRTVPINDLIRRQTAVDVSPAEDAKPVLFREHFIAMAELRRRVASDVNLFGSPWLFQYLTEFVDKRMLTALGGGDFSRIRDPISINLNMTSIATPEFRRFHENAGPYSLKVVIEMQLIDVFSDVNTFLRTRDWLQKEGYRVLIDGLSPLSLQFFDPSLLNPDFVKINWSSELVDGISSERLDHMRDMVATIGRDRIVMGRVETEATMKWALKLGIHRFQGYFVDRLVQAMAQKQIL